VGNLKSLPHVAHAVPISASPRASLELFPSVISKPRLVTHLRSPEFQASPPGPAGERHGLGVNPVLGMQVSESSEVKAGLQPRQGHKEQFQRNRTNSSPIGTSERISVQPAAAHNDLYSDLWDPITKVFCCTTLLEHGAGSGRLRCTLLRVNSRRLRTAGTSGTLTPLRW
jgi:hypothetical protein